jgi:hypothetical protein
MNTIKILPGSGLSTVPFGLLEAEVVSLLGKPDKAFFTDTDNKRRIYNELMIELSIEPENDNRFGWIEVHNPDFTFDGQRLIGKTKETVLPVVSDFLNEKPKLDDYNSMESYDFENNWVELQFEFNRLRCINLGVLYTENDVALWPKK